MIDMKNTDAKHIINHDDAIRHKIRNEINNHFQTKKEKYKISIHTHQSTTSKYAYSWYCN